MSTTTPAVFWNQSSGATSYSLFVSIAPYGTGNIVYQTTGLGGTSYTIPSGFLVNNGQYRWNMTASNGAGESGVSNTLYFTVSTTSVPSPPTITSPGSGGAPGTPVSTTTPTVFWNQSSGATSYSLFVSIAPYGTGNIVYQTTGLGGTSYTIPSGFLVNNGQYRWNMTASNGAGESGVSNTLYFTVSTTSVPSPPTITSPGSGGAPGTPVSTTTPTVFWSQSSGATSYSLFVSIAPYGTGNIVYQTTGLGGTSYTIPSGFLVNNGQYRWNMTASNGAGESGVSNTLYFTVSTTSVPSPPTITSPGSGSAPGPPVSTTAPTVFWNQSSGATSYSLFVSIAPYGTGNIVYQTTGLGGTSYTIPSGFLVNNGQYRWNMTASNGAGESGVSNVLYFTVSTTSGTPGTFTVTGSAFCETTAQQPGPAIRLNWSSSTGADTYVVYRNGAAYSGTLSSSQLSFDNNTSVGAGLSYTYFVRATNAHGSTDSNTTTVTVPSDVCSAGHPPGSFTAVGNASCAATKPLIVLTWTTSTGASAYAIHRDGAEIASGLPLSQTSFTDRQGIVAGQTYSYFARASSAGGTNDTPVVAVMVPQNVCSSPASGALRGRVVTGEVQPIQGVTVVLTGATLLQTVTDESGSYAFSGLPSGDYLLTPAYSNYTFTPRQAPARVVGGTQDVQSFVGTAALPVTPTVALTGPTVGFVTELLHFSVSAANCTINPNSWLWTTSDGQSYSGAANVGFTWSSAGPETVVVTNSACPGGSAALKIDISNPPQAFLHVEVLDPIGDDNLVNTLVASQGTLTTDLEVLATTSPPAVTGLVTDGVTRVLLRATVSGPGDVVFSVTGGPPTSSDGGLQTIGSQSGTASSLTVPTSRTHDGQYHAFAIFLSPADFNSNGAHGEERSRTIELKAAFRSNALQEANQTILLRLERPPVLLVHGIWSSAGQAWGKSPLLSDSRFLWHTFSYTNDVHFSQNASVVSSAINSLIMNARARLSYSHGQATTAVSQVDIGAHSMGGLLTRIWAGDRNYHSKASYGSGTIHKVITLDTPHSGSTLAQYLAFLRNSHDQEAYQCFRETLARHERAIDHGAVDDLAPDSSALKGIGASKLGAHVMIGNGRNSPCNDQDHTADDLDLLVAWCSEVDTGGFFIYLNDLFAAYGVSDHDGIVSVESQRGGMPDALTSGSYGAPDGVHVCCTSSEVYATEIVRLLNTSVLSSKFGSFGGGVASGIGASLHEIKPSRRFAPLTAAAPVPAQLRIQPHGFAAGAAVHPGDRVSVSVILTTTGSLRRILLVAPGISLERDASPYDFNVEIPQTASGEFDLSAFGKLADSTQVTSEPLTLQVVPQDAPASLQLLPVQPTLCGVGSTLQLNLIGRYTGGVYRDLTPRSIGTEYIPAVPEVASVSNGGLITGLRAGSTDLTVRNGGAEIKTSVLVTASCPSNPLDLYLNNGRFRVQVNWTSGNAGGSGVGTAVSLSSDTGYFWFFDPANVELVIKVLDGRGVNNSFWVFYGALSDVNYVITVTDTETGAVKTYYNKTGELASVADTSAFLDRKSSKVGGAALHLTGRELGVYLSDVSSLGGGHRGSSVQASFEPAEAITPESAGSCAPSAATLCLNDERFRVGVAWRSQAVGRQGVGTAVPLTSDTGYFWFFGSSNVELILKVLDGRGVNGKFWVFYGSLSDVEYTITVTDTLTGATKTYHNTEGHLASVADTSAF
ncbi:MAG TPA: carboxypeptidase regulatory-like domain-containing protein [Thermoanaerobaculia bacterium]|nr:carboxypeptidase regulatory-like domain-containing protein [Thermoanaerobaculia bacterium]